MDKELAERIAGTLERIAAALEAQAEHAEHTRYATSRAARALSERGNGREGQSEQITGRPVTPER